MNRRRVAQLENTVCELPDGYEVVRLAWNRFELRFNGEAVEVCSQLRYAYNAAQRHQRERNQH